MFDPDNPFVCLYEGYVVNNEDPLKMGRVKVNVPGLLEPESDWALPIASPGAGASNRGLWCVPAVGANVAVMFREGDLEQLRFFTGPWPTREGESVAPDFVTNLSAADATKVVGLQTNKWNIVADDRPSVHTLTLQSRDNPDNSITINGLSQSVEVNGTVAVQIKSSGIVSIEALQVVINGRVVLPTGKPI